MCVAQLVECVPTMLEILDSLPNALQSRVSMHGYNPGS